MAVVTRDALSKSVAEEPSMMTGSTPPKAGWRRRYNSNRETMPIPLK
ncbi:hypothetical protein H206_05467 [Candidatus Electrothrix aarhusensis]|uniref:Uncharacterized protein n=1 Tax=Candidatus Electrothrix aarhusensis TaxID=1859131 RepID=A0A444J4F9_9BACT|nr:hypothetical protein H206_05467 [Candidatus Electrothrix aarhusensis]